MASISVRISKAGMDNLAAAAALLDLYAPYAPNTGNVSELVRVISNHTPADIAAALQPVLGAPVRTPDRAPTDIQIDDARYENLTQAAALLGCIATRGIAKRLRRGSAPLLLRLLGAAEPRALAAAVRPLLLD